MVEFINTARDLSIYSIKQCIKIPKRYTFFIGTDISNTANDIFDSVVKANSIHPRNQHEAQIRRDLIVAAIASCESLVAKIGIVEEIIGLDEKALREWMKLVETELRLLRGVKKNDASRYKFSDEGSLESSQIQQVE